MDANDDVCAHLLSDVNWNVVEQAAIGIDMVPGANRSKNARQRHGASQGLRQGPAAEYVGFDGNQVGSNAGERNRQLVKALKLGVRKCNPVKNEINLLSRVKP